MYYYYYYQLKKINNAFEKLNYLAKFIYLTPLITIEIERNEQDHD